MSVAVHLVGPASDTVLAFVRSRSEFVKLVKMHAPRLASGEYLEARSNAWKDLREIGSSPLFPSPAGGPIYIAVKGLPRAYEVRVVLLPPPPLSGLDGSRGSKITSTNLYVLRKMLEKYGYTSIPVRVEQVDFPHLQRCFKAGLIAPNPGGQTLHLTEAGRHAIETDEGPTF